MANSERFVRVTRRTFSIGAVAVLTGCATGFLTAVFQTEFSRPKPTKEDSPASPLPLKDCFNLRLCS